MNCKIFLARYMGFIQEHRQGPNTRSNELSNQESLPIVGTYSQNMSETTVEPLFQASKDLHIDASDGKLNCKNIFHKIDCSAMDTNEDMSTFASEEINVTLGSDEEKKQNSTVSEFLLCFGVILI